MKYATLITSILIIIVVLIPGGNLPSVGTTGIDKLVHVAMFAVWSVAVRFDFNVKPFPYALVFFMGLAFSLLTEILQLPVEDRSFDWFDVAADTVGLVAGLLIGGPVNQWIRRRRS